MAKSVKKVIASCEEANAKKETFFDKLNHEMHYESNFNGNAMSFEWLDQIEFACPFIDNVVRNAKFSLVKEEMIVKAEKTKRITVESVKNLSRHPDYIEKVDPATDDVTPKKILNVVSEETFNIYENRFLYTLIHDMNRIVYEKEQELKNFQFVEKKFLEYHANTSTDMENVSIQLRVDSESFPSDKLDKKLKEQIKNAKSRIKKIKMYFTSWEHSMMYKELEKNHVTLLKPPIRKTNIILKNPNFQVAMKLFDYLQKLTQNEDSRSNLEKDEDPFLGFIDCSFLTDFCVLDSVSRLKREQKQKMACYAIVLLKEEVRRTLDLLLRAGIEVSDDELLQMLADELKKERSERLVGVEDVKKKFKNAMDEYLERMQDYL